MNGLEQEELQDEFLNSSKIRKDGENNFLNHALHYAEIGYPVFPLQNVVKTSKGLICSCKYGADCSRVAKHPRTRKGFKDATTETEIIKDWWSTYPIANIGILTGEESGIFVLDVDIEKGGHYSLNELEEYYSFQHDLEGVSGNLTAKSGSGGSHYYFKYNFDIGINSTAGAIGQGIDIRGDGGYIIAPPSLNSKGKYEWLGSNIPILDAPEWLLYEILKSIEKEDSVLTSSLLGLQSKVTIPKGQRHQALVKKISGLVNTFSEEEVLNRAMKFNDECFVPKLPEKEIVYQVRYLHKRYGQDGSKNMGLRK